ncbi:Meckel syndrome type 1 protein [Thalassophryne amazonica]|uniref:Meckel syndrome type 1 protein n=1 Tax=Thalassophryne amazonica TaxID=390379 RepID=UPI001470F637|nr:Meckel syndrome type 1 protein [Thalassophryne amazonica]
MTVLPCGSQSGVRLECVTSSAAVSKHLQQQISPQHERGAVELRTMTSQGHPGDAVEEVVVSWQEKLFSQYEMDLFQNEAACQTPLDRQYHTQINALIRLKHRPNHRIFTYTDHDRYTDCLTFHQLQHSTDLLTTTRSAPTFLAEKMANMRHRRQERRTTDSSIPNSKVINWEPTKEFVRNSHVVNNVLQTMYIMGDLGPPGQLGQKENEYLLLTIKTDGNGTVFVNPDFNKGKDPYRIVTEGEKREVWRLTVENISAAMKPEDQGREQNMYRDLYRRHKQHLSSVVGQDFEMPPVGVLRYVMYGEIVSARGFEYDNLCIQFFMELPNDWQSLPSQVLSGVTQTCRTKAMGKDNVAFFSYPFSCEAFCMDGRVREACSPHWPVLYFKILSLDSWQRCRTEGYGYVLFPSLPGKHTMTCRTWRPRLTGTVSALRRFFIGVSPELEDHSYVRIPGTFQGERLSRFGFCTETTGSVTFTLHSIQQARSFLDASVLKKRRQKVVDQLGGFSQQEALQSILEAFQRARTKMREARESLPRDLNTTSQLQHQPQDGRL